MEILLKRRFLISVILVVGSLSHAQEWTRFRGPNGQGISDANAIPVPWTDQQLNWKIKLPGGGHGSPVVWGNTVFVTCDDAGTPGARLLALNAADGSLRWRQFCSLPAYKFHNDNSYATGTPCVDADQVYVLWQSSEQSILAAFDHDGQPKWRRLFGSTHSRFGPGTSPMLHEDLVIFTLEQQAGGPNAQGQWLALDRKTGETRWTIPRNNREISYSTPCVFRPASGASQLLFNSWAHGITGVDPVKGIVLWGASETLPARVVSSPVLCEDLVISTCGKGGGGTQLSAVQIPAGGQGTPELVYSRTGKTVPYVPTCLAKDDLLFAYHDNGRVTCMRVSTGEPLWSEKPAARFYGSPVWVDGWLYCMDRKGNLVVLEASATYKLLAVHSLGEKTHATPAVSGGRMYLRTYSHLISVGGQE
ncbi:MAG: PQQ-binding-like beta-propeller repeat protein [Phycisphaeraceae bacterium]|nr:PQQ-binding-like beta-propeller repeat protein [Phycisphaeraceae bacterium]